MSNQGIVFLRQGAQKVAGNRQRGNFRGSYHMNWRAPKKPANSAYQVGEPIAFIDADYPDAYVLDELTGQPSMQPAFHRKKHTFKFGDRISSMECSAGPDQYHQQPCVACWLASSRKQYRQAQQQASGGKRTKGESEDARDLWTFNIAHLVPYHQVPWVKEVNGVPTIQMKENSNEPVLIKEQCGLRGCQYCTQGYQTVFGAHRYLEVGSRHLQTVLSWNDKVGMNCANCLTPVSQLEFECGHCNKVVLDVANSGYTNEQLGTFAKTPMRCPYCHQVGLPREVIDCGYDPRGVQKIQGTGCPDNVEPRRLTVFDVVIYVQREGEGTDSKLVDIYWQPKSQFQTPTSVHVDEVIKEVVPSPLDFAGLFKPLDLNSQAERLNVQNPFVQQGGYQQPQYQQQQPPMTYNQQPAPAMGPPQQGWPQQQPMPGQMPAQQPYGQPQFGPQTPYQAPYPQQGVPQQGPPQYPPGVMPPGTGRPPYGQ